MLFLVFQWILENVSNMFLDARELDDQTSLEADLCIVGMGAAGITLARRLAGTGLRVIALESGGFEQEAALQDLYKGRMSGIRTWTLSSHRFRFFGGGTMRWNGLCMPLSPEDLRGWPFDFDELVPYYRTAQLDLELAGFGYDPRTLLGKTGELIPGSGRLETRVFQLSPPTRMGTLYRDELASASNLRIYLRANVTEIVLDSPLRRVSHLQVETLQGQRFSVSADRYVLATGGIENARLLLASRNQVEAGVANSSGLVGAYFAEHPHFFNSAVLVDPSDMDLGFYRRMEREMPTDQGTRTSGTTMGMVALTKEVRDAEGLPNMMASIHPVPLDKASTGKIGPHEIPALTRSDLGRHRALRFTVHGEQTPMIDSRLTLTDEQDALGMPRLDLHWIVSEDDQRAYSRALEILGAEFALSGMGRLWAPVDEARRLKHAIRPGGHHMGTTRISDDPREGVVDANGRAHDVENLYLAGSSVFPTTGVANPTLTIVALSNRLAQHLGDTAS